MRDGALPSRVSQARFFSELLDWSGRGNFRVNLFEAYDEPWKRQWEGTVGAHWGLLDGESRQLKYALGSAVSNYPFWKLQLGAGLAFGFSTFAVALVTLWRRRTETGLAPWLAVAASATTGGILLGLGAEKAFYESYGFAGWLNQGILLAAATVLPLLCASALIAGRPLPAFLELVGPREGRTRSAAALILGFALMATTLVAAEIALGLVFDPRSRDFPFASLTMVVVPIWTVTLLNRGKSDAGATTEAVFAGLFVVAALYIFFNEGTSNWQSLWTAAGFFLLGATLWPSRFAAISGVLWRMPAVFSKTLGKDELAVQPIAVASVPPPKVECDQ
jgi:hypothetical protein